MKHFRIRNPHIRNAVYSAAGSAVTLYVMADRMSFEAIAALLLFAALIGALLGVISYAFELWQVTRWESKHADVDALVHRRQQQAPTFHERGGL